jgi:4-amino-4-deoxy-L-arabinose transferase-like glycosyltransferase
MQPLSGLLKAKPFRAVLLLCLGLFLSGAWLLPLIDRDEPRFAEASREMLQRGDLVIPWFNGQYRFDKPPLIYWCQMASYQIFGQNAFAARLPSALFATATALLLLHWGRRLGKPTAGLYAALIFATCLQVLIHARLAVADMPMVFFVAASVRAGWEWTRPENRQRGLWFTAFFTSLALGFLAKGPEAWLPVIGLVCARLRRPRHFTLSWSHLIPGLSLTLALVSLWGVPALIQTHGEYLEVGIGRHVLHRSFDVMEGHGLGGLGGYLIALPFFFVTFFLTFFPWALKFPATWRAWRATASQDHLGWYLLLQALLVFLVFTVVHTKLLHYTLPAFPCLALWLGLRLAESGQSETFIRRSLVGMIALTLILTLGVFTVGRHYSLSSVLWQKVKPHARPEMRLVAVGFEEPSLVWEFRGVLTNTAEFLPASRAAELWSQPAPVILVLPTSLWTNSLSAQATNATLLQASGIDTARFKHWDLTAVIRP